MIGGPELFSRLHWQANHWRFSVCAGFSGSEGIVAHTLGRACTHTCPQSNTPTFLLGRGDRRKNNKRPNQLKCYHCFQPDCSLSLQSAHTEESKSRFRRRETEWGIFWWDDPSLGSHLLQHTHTLLAKTGLLRSLAKLDLYQWAMAVHSSSNTWAGKQGHFS